YLASVPAAARPPIPPDRYVFYVTPLLFVVFAAWIEAGVIRPTGTAPIAWCAGAVVMAAALVGVSEHPHATINGSAFLPWTYLGANHRYVLILPLAAWCALCVRLFVRRAAD